MNAGGSSSERCSGCHDSQMEGEPTLTLSIDFNQRWGVRSQVGPRAHAVDEAFLQAPDLVHRMLVALDRADASATWFVPAALSCGSWDEYFAVAAPRPSATRRLDADHPAAPRRLIRQGGCTSPQP